MKTTTATYFKVSRKGDNGYFANDGYSGYYARLTLDRADKLPEGEQVYGYKEALEHIKELREHIYEGKKIYAFSEFEITTVTEVHVTIDSPV